MSSGQFGYVGCDAVRLTGNIPDTTRADRAKRYLACHFHFYGLYVY